jgi:hypothetical protein
LRGSKTAASGKRNKNKKKIRITFSPLRSCAAARALLHAREKIRIKTGETIKTQALYFGLYLMCGCALAQQQEPIFYYLEYFLAKGSIFKAKVIQNLGFFFCLCFFFFFFSMKIM